MQTSTLKYEYLNSRILETELSRMLVYYFSIVKSLNQELKIIVFWLRWKKIWVIQHGNSVEQIQTLGNASSQKWFFFKIINTGINYNGCSGSVGRALDWDGDPKIASSSLTAGGVTVLCPLARHFICNISWLVLVQPR